MEQKILEIPALGRPVQLGALYDCRGDTAIPGMTLWDLQTQNEDRDIRNQRETQVNILNSDDVKTKTLALSADASLKASLLSGLVNVAGSARFFNDKKKSNNQCRKTIHYKTTIRRESLMMKMVGDHNIQHLHVFEHGTATHVVTSILYGAQAFFVFDRFLTPNENKQNIDTEMNEALKHIIRGEEYELEARKMECTFYSDLEVKITPTNYKEAVSVFNQLPFILGDNAVPLTVFLYPLSSLDHRAARVNRAVSGNLVNQIEDVIEGLNMSEVRCNDLISNISCREFISHSQKIHLFRKLISDFKNRFQQEFAIIISDVRGGRAKEESLAKLLSDIEQSPFNLQQQSLWLRNVETELGMLQTYVTELRFCRIIGSAKILNKLLLTPSWEYIVCFSFGFADQDDEYLKHMARYIKHPMGGMFKVEKTWLENVSTSRKTRRLFKQFSQFAKLNQRYEKTLFGVMSVGDINKKPAEGGSVFLYGDGSLVTKELVLPGVPGKPSVIETSDTTATLKWDPPRTGLSPGQYYLLRYREATRVDNRWTDFKGEVESTKTIITNLNPNTDYECCVATGSSIGEGQPSRISEVFSTADSNIPKAPSHIRILKVSDKSLTIEWDIPVLKNDSLIIRGYKVKCEAVSGKTKGKCFIDENLPAKCIYTIKELAENTTYRIRVCAVYNKGGDSPFSDHVYISTAQKQNRRRIAEEVITCSVEIRKGDISKGEPSIFKVPLTQGHSGSRSKYNTYRFGTNIVHKRHLVIMIVGASGAGKSTLINGMINYILNVEWTDPFRFQIIADQGENRPGGQTQSQTQIITAYTIYNRKGLNIDCSLTIIDTPGFGDTRGIERDKFIVDQTRELFNNSTDPQIDHIDAIGFVAQASQARLTHTQMYVFDSILAIFGKDVGSNIMLLITFADGQKPPVLEAIKAANIPCWNNMFKFNNSALFANNPSKSKTPVCKYSDSSEDEQEENFDKMFWKMNIQSMRNFFKSLQEAEPKSLRLTKMVLEERKRLEAVVKGLQPQIKMGCSKLEELRKEQRILEQHEREIEANKKFVYQVNVSKFRKVQIFGEYITNCGLCHFTCHYPCSIPDDKNKIKCDAMKNGNCTVCRGKCVWNLHFNQGYRVEWYIEKETRKYTELERKYNDATGKKLTVEQVIKKHQKEFSAFQESVFDLIIESLKCMDRLKEIALRPNPLSTVEYVDLLIESEKQEAKPGWQGRVVALESVRKDAEIMCHIQKANYSPWEQYRGDIPGLITIEQFERYKKRVFQASRNDSVEPYDQVKLKEKRDKSNCLLQ